MLVNITQFALGMFAAGYALNQAMKHQKANPKSKEAKRDLLMVIIFGFIVTIIIFTIQYWS